MVPLGVDQDSFGFLSLRFLWASSRVRLRFPQDPLKDSIKIPWDPLRISFGFPSDSLRIRSGLRGVVFGLSRSPKDFIDSFKSIVSPEDYWLLRDGDMDYFREEYKNFFPEVPGSVSGKPVDFNWKDPKFLAKALMGPFDEDNDRRLNLEEFTNFAKHFGVADTDIDVMFRFY